MATEDNKPSTCVPVRDQETVRVPVRDQEIARIPVRDQETVRDQEEVVVIDAINEEDNDAGYIDPMSLRQSEHILPTTTCIDPGHNSTNGHSLATSGMNGHSVNGHHRYIQHHGSPSRKYTKNILQWIQQKINCLLSWIISILAIVSMVLKLPFFVFLITVLLDLIKQRLKAKAAKNSANVESINKPYEEEPNAGGSSGGQSTKGLLIEGFIFILLLVALILIQFLVFITHAFSASKCCKNGCCCDGDNHGCGHEYHRKARRERIRKLILSVYFVPLTLWIIVFISSYYLNEWPYFGGGILMMFKLLIHGNSLTGTPDMYQVTLMKYYSFIGDLISLITLITYFVLEIITCCKHGSRYNHTCAMEDACDSSKELTGRQSSSSKCSSPGSHGNKSDLKVSSPSNRRHNYPKACTMKWYTINCGCFTLFDPRKKKSVMSMRNSSPMHEKIAPCSDSSRGTPSDCCCSSNSESGGDTCDDESAPCSSGAYIHAGQIVDHEIDGQHVAETSLLVRNTLPSAPPGGGNREEEGRLLQ